jgi:hypothetical protein
MSDISSLLVEAYQGNLTTLSALQLCCRFTDRQAARMCCVSPETYRRWRRDRVPNPTAIRLMAILAGYVPWSGWDGWEVHNGSLFPPGYCRHGIRPGQILAIPFREQLVTEYQRQLAVLRDGSTVAAAGQSVPRP